MLARRGVPPEYQEWNRRWSAPFGNRSRPLRFLEHRAPRVLDRVPPRLRGPFAFQPNNDTRAFEYPWAYFATPLEPGMRALEIGGGLSGFQFVLARDGLEVINVDPGEAASGVGWPCDAPHVARLNRAFHTEVDLRNTTLDRAGVADASNDRVFAISVIEHIPTAEIAGLAAEIRRVLRPGGHVILTLDLFLDLAPFTGRAENRFGWNIDVKHLVEALDLPLVVGDPAELNGYPQFDPREVLAQLPSLVYGFSYPVCTQLLVLRHPDPDPPAEPTVATPVTAVGSPPGPART